MSSRDHESELPTVLQRRHTDEYAAPAYTDADRRVIARLESSSPEAADRVGRSLAAYSASRLGTAAGLRAINEEWGSEFYAVPPEATTDTVAADEALGSSDPVIDVQTHYIADRPECSVYFDVLEFYRTIAPRWWRGIDSLTAFNLAEYLRCVFVESETAVAVLSSAPGTSPSRMLFNDELAGTRELLERVGQSGRLLNHAVVHPNDPRELDEMERWRDAYHPSGWKVYTLGHTSRDGWIDGWMLDDEDSGVPFLERCRDLDVRLVCAHKGISFLAPTGSPRDIGPVAAAFTDIDFLVYHSAYEIPDGENAEEGPYSDDTADVGTNRLVTTLRASNLRPGSNVYAELGTTWFSLIRRPAEAAHVLGKLLSAVGEDNVIWGTDSIWYGPSQPAIDAFRSFQIPEEYCEQYGYPRLTREVKEKILSRNAARVYGIDLDAARRAREHEDLAWVELAREAYLERGVPSAA